MHRSAGLFAGLRARCQLRQYRQHLSAVSADRIRSAEGQKVDRRCQGMCAFVAQLVVKLFTTCARSSIEPM